MIVEKYIKNKEQFKNYIMSELGTDYNCIELSDEQLENIIQITIQKWTELAYDGLLKRVYILPITTGQFDYQLGTDPSTPRIYSVIEVIEDTVLINNFQSLDRGIMIANNFFQNAFTGRYNFKMLDYEIAGEHMEMYNKIYKKKTSYSWDEPTQTFHIYDDTNRALASKLALFVYQYHDNDIGLYNKIWVKEYAVARARLVWGRNLMKFGTVTLPGSATINFDGIITEAKFDMDKLEKDLLDLGPLSDFFIG